MFLFLNMCFSWIETAQPLGNLCWGKGGSERYFLIKKKKKAFQAWFVFCLRRSSWPRGVFRMLSRDSSCCFPTCSWYYSPGQVMVEAEHHGLQYNPKLHAIYSWWQNKHQTGMLLQSGRTKVFTLLLAGSVGVGEAPGGPAQDAKRSECAGRRLGFTMRAVLLGNL